MPSPISSSYVARTNGGAPPARIYANDQRMAVRSAGVSKESRHLVSAKDIEWADLILVMEQKHKSRLKGVFPDLDMPMVKSLDIPDEYQFMDEELIGLIREGTEIHLREEFGI